MYLYHYFDKEREPFLSMSDLPEKEARIIIDAFESFQEEKDGREYKMDETDSNEIPNPTA